MQSSYYTLADSPCVSLIVPGLLASEAVGSASVHTPYLNRCLSRALESRKLTDSLESAVLKWFNGRDTSNQNCAAVLGYRLEIGAPESDANLLRADPVYQQMDINHAVLADQSVLELTHHESQSITDTLNKHFASDGLVFSVAQEALRWYCNFSRPLEIRTRSPGSATGRDVSAESPVGPDAAVWRTWLTEIEMLLYSHPVNLEREQSGKVPVNSLWLWGEGLPVHSPLFSSSDAVVFSDNFYTRSIANHGAINCRASEAFSQYEVTPQSCVLFVDDQFHRAAATGDEELRIKTLGQLEKNVFEPLWRNLGRGGWRSVQIWVGGDRWLQLDSSARYQFWRRQKALSHFLEFSGTDINDN